MPLPGSGQPISSGESCAEFGLDGLEMIDEIFTSGYSLTPDETSNRMHAIKAVLVVRSRGNQQLRLRFPG